MQRLFSTAPRGALKWLLGLPRLLYRLRLGWLLGHRFLMLTHCGRRSGRLYHTVVEVARYDARRRESVVMAGWGEQTDWYRNLQAGGGVGVDTGGQRYQPEVRFLEAEEVDLEMMDYFRRHAWAGAVARRFFGVGVAAGAPGERLCGVVLRPRKEYGR